MAVTPDVWVQPALHFPGQILTDHVVDLWPGYDAVNIPHPIVERIRGGDTALPCPNPDCPRDHPWVLFLDETHPIQLDCTRGVLQ